MGQLEQLGAGSAYKSTIGDMLERAEMFRDFPRKDIDLLSDYVQAYKAKNGVVIIKEAEKPRSMYVLVEGRLDISKGDGDEIKTLATVRPGKSVGEMSIIDGQPTSATVTAADESTLLLLTKLKFDTMTVRHSELALKIALKIARLMSLRLRQTSGMLSEYLD